MKGQRLKQHFPCPHDPSNGASNTPVHMAEHALRAQAGLGPSLPSVTRVPLPVAMFICSDLIFHICKWRVLQGLNETQPSTGEHTTSQLIIKSPEETSPHTAAPKAASRQDGLMACQPHLWLGVQI